MRLKDWFKTYESLSGEQFCERHFHSSLDKLRSKNPWNKKKIRKWRDNFYNANSFPVSPINLKRDSAQTLFFPPLEWVNFTSAPYSSKIINSGHTTVVKAIWYEGKMKPYLTGGPFLDQKYIFYHTHFHWGESEHALQGEFFPMEVHSVFYNSKYKSYENALKENDGIVIVAKFCRLLPESPRRTHTAPLVTNASETLRNNEDLFNNASFRSSRSCKSVKHVNPRFLQRNSGRYQMSKYKEYKPVHYTEYRSVQFYDVSTVILDDKQNRTGLSSHKTTSTNETTRRDSREDQSNVFIGEIAKNVRFVRSVNTSKLIHAYSMDQLLPQFTGNYFFYLSGIRRHQTTHRITWIVEDKNHLVISKAQLKSFNVLRNVQKSKLNNSRRTKLDPTPSSNMFYILNLADDSKTNSRAILENYQNIKEDYSTVNNIEIKRKSPVPILKNTKDRTNLSLQKDILQTLDNIENDEKSKCSGVVHLDEISIDIVGLDDEENLSLKEESNAMDEQEIINQDNSDPMNPEPNSSSTSSKAETEFFSKFPLDSFDENHSLVFNDIVSSINFNIETPFCSSPKFNDQTRNSSIRIRSPNKEVLSLYRTNHKEKSSLSLISKNKQVLSSRFQKLLKIILTHRETYQTVKMKNEISIVRTGRNKYHFKNKYILRKIENCKLINIMSVYITHNSVNVVKIINKIHQLEGIENEDHNAENESPGVERHYIDSSIFDSISIPSFSLDLDHQLNYTSFNSDADERSSEVDSDCRKLKIPKDTKIPRPKTLISERKRANLNLSVQEPLVIKSRPTTGIRIPSSAPLETTRNKMEDSTALSLNRPTTERTNSGRQDIVYTKGVNVPKKLVVKKETTDFTNDTIKVTQKKTVPNISKTKISYFKDINDSTKKAEVLDDGRSATSVNKLLIKTRRVKAFTKRYKLKSKKQE